MIFYDSYKAHQASIIFLLLMVAIIGCKTSPVERPLFEVLSYKRTGLDFTNKLTPDSGFNVFKYMYFYNGAGVGAGDFNNDGLIDLFFSSNQGQNKLYLNTGDLRFKDVTKQARIPLDSSWSTGVAIADINNDGLLDMYISKVGHFETLNSRNQLLMCQGIDKMGIPVYENKAHEYGLDFSGFSTQAAFLDHDMDGDLDLFLLNHSVHQNGTFGPRKSFTGTYHQLSGDRIYRNDEGSFTDITRETGINSSAISYGLGVAVGDINLDGYPDLYIGNDFHENDYLYINQQDGTFREELARRIMHTSQYSMGVDIGDINNDGYPEIVSMDMLPEDPYILKRSLGEDAYDIFNLKIGYGYHYQYTRNNLQLNRRNGMFSEVGLYAGVHATDWSWASLWMDFDNDGLKDLFVSNGIPKRLNDIDYVNFVSNDQVQAKIKMNSIGGKDMALIDKFPQIKIPNKFFKNTGQVVFKDQEKMIKGNLPTYSNGAAYADLDNDGDLDIVVNNIDEPALVYQNKTNDDSKKSFLQIKLSGPAKNINAVGSKVLVFAGNEIRSYEKYPVRGFQSSMEVPVHIGLYNARVDSIVLIWPDNTFEAVQIASGTSVVTLSYKEDLPVFDYSTITTRWRQVSKQMEDITQKVGLLHLHKENSFHEFDREPLIPHMVSTDGPALSVADINHDGLHDVFIGSSKWKESSVFLQSPSGTFEKTPQVALHVDSTYEDVDACWADVNNDGNTDLIVASGGNEFYGEDKHLTPRVYLNDGRSRLTKLSNAFEGLFVNASCVVPYDFNGDGYTDIFIGGRSIPWEYGEVPRSYLLQNDGTGKFRDVTSQYSNELSEVGFVTKALWLDLDKNGHKDLIISLEWGGIGAFMNYKGTFVKKWLTEKSGWWNFILPVDVNNDGKIDFVAGNLGLNSRLKASENEPVKLFYSDFDGNGKKEQVLTYYLKGKEIPFANKAELEKQLPGMKKKFLYAGELAKASLNEVFTREKLSKSNVIKADYFANAILLNKGNLNFDLQPLPWEAQLTSYRDGAVVNANDDNLPDILLAGNYYENNIEMGRYDADFGTVLINQGQGKFVSGSVNGIEIKGQVRRIQKIDIAGKEAYIFARNNDSTIVISFKEKNSNAVIRSASKF